MIYMNDELQVSQDVRTCLPLPFPDTTRTNSSACMFLSFILLHVLQPCLLEKNIVLIRTVRQCIAERFRSRKWPFFRPKRRKQAFIGSRNKRPSSAVLLPDAVARWRGRRALPQSPFGRHEVNIAEKPAVGNTVSFLNE